MRGVKVRCLPLLSEPPRVPVTQMRSPGRAPSRRTDAPVGGGGADGDVEDERPIPDADITPNQGAVELGGSVVHGPKEAIDLR